MERRLFIKNKYIEIKNKNVLVQNLNSLFDKGHNYVLVWVLRATL